jgi:hypothetical protein
MPQKHNGRASGANHQHAQENQRRLTAGLSTNVVTDGEVGGLTKIAAFGLAMSDAPQAETAAAHKLITRELSAASGRSQSPAWRNRENERFRAERTVAQAKLDRAQVAFRVKDILGSAIEMKVPDETRREYERLGCQTERPEAATYLKLRLWYIATPKRKEAA